MAILKASEYIQHLNEEKSASIHRQQNSPTTATKPQTTCILIGQISNKVLDMERHEWKVEFSCVKAHVGQRGDELLDRLAKEHPEARTSRNATIDSRKALFPVS
jgi:ribonuclease HI